MADLSIRKEDVRATSLASMESLSSATILSVNMPGSVSLAHSQRQHDPVVGHAGTLDEKVAAFGDFHRALHERSFARSPFDFDFMDFPFDRLGLNERHKSFTEIEPVRRVGL